MIKNTLLCFLILFVTGCNTEEFSPNQKFNATSPKDVNRTEINNLSQKKTGPAVRIAVSGDAQRDYTDSQRFVDYINSRNDIDFVVLNGDVSDFGLLLEFQ
ncbi:MAG TPA: metallophosphoesterase, partial [Pedobacter sp.]